uniref:Calcyclin binding protein n=1 Tax=Fundulus heteroclitus TaxID=8078 RepID=A0A3Q2Q1U6_FUNHE
MDVAEQISQLEADLQELSSLLEKAERKRLQELLKQEQKKVEKELASKRQQQEQQARREAGPSAASKAAYTVKITSYAWDQSEKFVKIYLDLKEVHKIPAENVEVNFTERSFSVLIKDLNGKNHQMTVLNLLHPIDDKESYKKVSKTCNTKVRKASNPDLFFFSALDPVFFVPHTDAWQFPPGVVGVVL